MPIDGLQIMYFSGLLEGGHNGFRVVKADRNDHSDDNAYNPQLCHKASLISLSFFHVKQGQTRRLVHTNQGKMGVIPVFPPASRAQCRALESKATLTLLGCTGW